MLTLLAIAFGKDMATATIISLEPFVEATLDAQERPEISPKTATISPTEGGVPSNGPKTKGLSAKQDSASALGKKTGGGSSGGVGAREGGGCLAG